MAEMVKLQATKRQVTGKEVRHLREAGIVPGILYGPTFDAIPLQIEWVDLRPALLEAGGSQIIKLTLDGDEYNALVRDVQRAPLHGEVMHIDFYRVRMDVVIRTEVPVVLIGATNALDELGGTIIHETNSVEVECLPGDLPSEIQVDVSGLTEVGNMILAKDLPELPGVTYHIDSEDVIVTTSYLQRLEEEEEEEEEEELLEEGTEPELIRRREEEEGEEEV